MSSDQGDGSFGGDAFTRMWSQFAAKMMELGLSFAPQATPPEAAREVRSSLLRAWADYCDQFMRSEEFLNMLKQSLAGAIQARQQLNNFLGEMQHNFQGTSRQDADELMASLQRVERRLLDETQRIAARLDELSARLAKVERLSGRPDDLAPRPAPAERIAERPKESRQAKRPSQRSHRKTRNRP